MQLAMLGWTQEMIGSFLFSRVMSASDSVLE